MSSNSSEDNLTSTSTSTSIHVVVSGQLTPAASTTEVPGGGPENITVYLMQGAVSVPVASANDINALTTDASMQSGFCNALTQVFGYTDLNGASCAATIAVPAA